MWGIREFNGLQLAYHPEQSPDRDVVVLAAVTQVRYPGLRNELPNLRLRQLPAKLGLHDVSGFLLRDARQGLTGMKPRAPLLQGLPGEDLLQFVGSGEQQPAVRWLIQFPDISLHGFMKVLQRPRRLPACGKSRNKSNKCRNSKKSENQTMPRGGKRPGAGRKPGRGGRSLGRKKTLKLAFEKGIIGAPRASLTIILPPGSAAARAVKAADILATVDELKLRLSLKKRIEEGEIAVAKVKPSVMCSPRINPHLSGLDIYTPLSYVLSHFLDLPTDCSAGGLNDFEGYTRAPSRGSDGKRSIAPL